MFFNEHRALNHVWMNTQIAFTVPAGISLGWSSSLLGKANPNRANLAHSAQRFVVCCALCRCVVQTVSTGHGFVIEKAHVRAKGKSQRSESIFPRIDAKDGNTRNHPFFFKLECCYLFFNSKSTEYIPIDRIFNDWELVLKSEFARCALCCVALMSKWSAQRATWRDLLQVRKPGAICSRIFSFHVEAKTWRNPGCALGFARLDAKKPGARHRSIF